MDKDILKILGLCRAEFEKSGLYELLATISIFAIAILSISSIFASKVFILYILAIFILISSILNCIFSFLASRSKTISDRARRIILFIDGFGYKATKKMLTDLSANFTVSNDKGKKWEDKKYFRSDLTAGYKRLAIILQENIFFSKNLFKYCSKFNFALFVILLAISILILLLLPFFENTNFTIQFVRIIIIVLIFLASSNLAGKTIKFYEASNKIDKIDERLESYLKFPDESENDLLIIFTDYNSIVELTPLIPTFIYKCNRDNLNRLWEQRI